MLIHRPLIVDPKYFAPVVVFTTTNSSSVSGVSVVGLHASPPPLGALSSWTRPSSILHSCCFSSSFIVFVVVIVAFYIVGHHDAAMLAFLAGVFRYPCVYLRAVEHVSAVLVSFEFDYFCVHTLFCVRNCPMCIRILGRIIVSSSISVGTPLQYASAFHPGFIRLPS